MKFPEVITQSFSQSIWIFKSGQSISREKTISQ